MFFLTRHIFVKKFQRLFLSEPEQAEAAMTCLNKIGSLLCDNIPTEEHSGFMLVRHYYVVVTLLFTLEQLLQRIHRSKVSMLTVQPEDAKSKCVLLNEKQQEFIINYQIACSGSLYSGKHLTTLLKLF